MGFKTFDFKLGNMRKAQNWIVCPVSNTEPNMVTVQSDKSIGRFDKTTGEGVLNTKGSYFIHLTPQAGAKPFTFPKEFIDLALGNETKTGDSMGGVHIG